jgi:hypothetical protein
MGTTGMTMISDGAPGATAVLLVTPDMGVNLLFKGCTLLVNPNNVYQLRALVLDDAGAGAFQVSVPSIMQSPTCCGAKFMIQGATFGVPAMGGPLTLLEITNGVQLVLGN